MDCTQCDGEDEGKVSTFLHGLLPHYDGEDERQVLTSLHGLLVPEWSYHT